MSYLLAMSVGSAPTATTVMLGPGPKQATSRRVRSCKAEESSWQRNFHTVHKTQLSELRRRQTLLSTIHVNGSEQISGIASTLF
jgi:hypothetical protein